jgi:peptide/nickel transport system substrate-binding protein
MEIPFEQNIRFHDGSYLTPQTVKPALENVMRSANLDTTSFLSAIEEIKPLDDSTISIVTKKPFAILSRSPFVYIWKSNARKAFPPIVGTGPYRLSNWHKGESISLIRWNGYWEEPPSFQKVTFLPVADATERIDRLKRGVADIAYSIPAGSITEMPEVHFTRRPGLTVYYLGFDLSPLPDNPFADPRVRKAIHIALNRDAIVRSVLHGFGTVPTQPVAPFVFGYNPSLPKPSQDIELAKNLLAQAGYSGGFHARLDLGTSRVAAAGILQQDLRKIGIETDLNGLSLNEVYTLAESGKSRFFLIGWDCTSGDASEFYEYCAHTRNKNYGRGDYGHYSNATLDHLIEASTEITDENERKSMLQEQASIIMQDLPIIPVYIEDDIYDVRNSIEFEPRADSEIKIMDVKVVKKQNQ